METLQHKEAPKGHIHIIHNLEFMTMSERDTYTPKIEDLDKICLVRSPYCFYVLKSISPLEWKEIGGVSKEDLDKKQEKLESGVNIKKINGTDILGEGNIEIRAIDEIYKSENNPTITTNPKNTGELWVNFVTPEIFICKDNTIDKNTWKGMFTGKTIAPKKIFNFNLFDDGTAVGLFELETDTKDKGNISKITLNNMYFTDGISGKGIKANDATGRIDINGSGSNIRTISFFAKLPTTIPNNNYFIDCRKYGASYYCYLTSGLAISGMAGMSIYQNGILKGAGAQLTISEWTHFLIIFNGNISGAILLNYMNDMLRGIPNIEIDHIRLFNRVITSTEITALRNEIL